ncbi:Arabinanase/levansucrase/invertase [Piromyces finnis]|uniref:Arabinanase/levansucrase/invertase n=1 Tax=Piromyces finnis TaxID=1754191 RepID=A0A1Y1V3R0_9FUNG|nr:Arabinanase/levansucrase/invertase [Piromyces finnis]|eukprot:ORX46603.1 Arabinanase/levansucrase/invertase [Piromyces finnis]
MKTTLFTSIILYTIFFINTTFGAGEASFGGVTASKPIKPVTNKNPLITHRYSADPGVMVYKDRVYVYSSNDGDVANKNVGENKYDQINTINCMSSSDLVNWMDHGPIAAAGGGGAAKWAKNSWAPSAAWKTINGKDKFFLYFANSGSGIGVLTSDSPTGPFTDPLGRALITPQTPNCASITWLFDPAAFVDADGTGYLYFGGGVPQGQSANPKTVRVVKLGNDMTSLAGEPQTIDAPWVFEDSGIHKMGNTYFYSYCTNWDNGPYGNARIAYMTSNSPMGPFSYKGTCFNNPGDFFQTTGNNHHTIIEFKNKYYIFYHTEWLNKQVFGSQKGYRTTHVDEMPVNGNSLGNAKGTLTGVTQIQDVDGSALNYAACFAWQSGISVKGQAAVTTVNYSRGGWTGVSNVALGNAQSITLKASSASGATIKICTGSENGQAIGYVDIPAGGSLQNVTGKISGASGTKNLFFVSSGDASIESWQLGGGSGAPAANNTPVETGPATETAPIENTPIQNNGESFGNTAPNAPITDNSNSAPAAGNDNTWGGFGGGAPAPAPAGGDNPWGGFGGFGGGAPAPAGGDNPWGGFGGFGGGAPAPAPAGGDNPWGGFGGFGGGAPAPAPAGGDNPWGGFGGFGGGAPAPAPAGGDNPWGGFGGFGGGAPAPAPAGGDNPWGGFGGAPANAAAEPAPSQGSNCAGMWAQCGGNGFSGPTCCQSGTCVFINEWFSMCK